MGINYRLLLTECKKDLSPYQIQNLIGFSLSFKKPYAIELFNNHNLLSSEHIKNLKSKLQDSKINEDCKKIIRKCIKSIPNDLLITTQLNLLKISYANLKNSLDKKPENKQKRGRSYSF